MSIEGDIARTRLSTFRSMMVDELYWSEYGEGKNASGRSADYEEGFIKGMHHAMALLQRTREMAEDAVRGR